MRGDPGDATVVFIDSGGGGEGSRLTEVVRGMCGVPVADIDRAHLAITEQVVRGIERAGRRPVLPRRAPESPWSGSGARSGRS